MAVSDRWRKSTYSGEAVACVEIGQRQDHIAIRDTKNRLGGTLVVSRAAFGSFLSSVKSPRRG
ncbi:hypothetical protein FHR81_001751 [Actinoalloteichus hoggarensis]|uniref:Uncharacterized protein n=1 Tax=Actinoalloteichus hoggarensis TaxID=1470176 RepID=A0A221W4Y5_9PSEU|nr:DUF397 domain-containing protein [Actinoalloteichus hoggarensis]ASO20783.1 hypothetical protein AHOG_15785 [Actinoalloteichus hoggarensis]MBB5920713.1 hypothetical protein [Actinoalloteichus hoggarensis]